MLARSILISLCAAMLFGAATGCSKNKGGGRTLQDQVREARKIGSPEPRARRLAKLGHDQFRAGDATGAGECLTDAAKVVQEIKDPMSRASAATYVARAMALCNEKPTAYDLLKQAAEATEQIQNIAVRSTALAEIGSAQGKTLHDGEAAGKTLKSAAELANQAGDGREKIHSLVAIAEAYTNYGNQADAISLLNGALTFAKTIEDPAQRTSALAEIASAQDPLLDPAAPREAFDAAIASAGEIPDDYAHVLALADLGKRLVDAKRMPQARAVVEQAKLLVPKISAVDLQKEADEKIHHVAITLKK